MNTEFLKGILESFSKAVTIQNVSLMLGLIGSAGTAWNVFSSMKRLKVKILDSVYRTDIGTLVIVIMFENHSRLPISVTEVTLISGKDELHFESYPRCVSEYYHKKGDDVVDKKFLYNLSFPVSLSQFEAVSGHLLIDISREDFEKLPTRLTIKVRSSRGLEQKMQLNAEDIKLTTLSHIRHRE